MLAFFLDYSLFFAKSFTVFLLLTILIVIIINMARKGDPHAGKSIKMEKLNDKLAETKHQLRSALLSKKQRKEEEKQFKKKLKEKEKEDEEQRKRIFVLDFKGDMKATGVANLREEITAVIAIADEGDEVLLRLENAGGLVHEHGLAASQLARLRQKSIDVTVAVDKVAASGGYLMACVAQKIVAAPFAILGSIGVLAQLPNFNSLLKEKGIQIEQFKGGQFKRTVTMLGENTDADREKFQDEIKQTHDLFKDYVIEHRPELDIEAVATGEHWYGTQAIALGLCDEIITSDDWILQQSESSHLYVIKSKTKPSFSKKLSEAFAQVFTRTKLNENNNDYFHMY